jgi:hypothetical protein
VLRLVLATCISAVVCAPLAFSWALNSTQVEQTVGITPTTFSVTTAGHSELRLGVPGTLYVPRSFGPFGVVATVQGPGVPQGTGADQGDLGSYVTPQMLQLYTGLFHDPGPALEEYIDVLTRALWHRAVVAELFTAVVGGLVLFATHLLLTRRALLAPRLAREFPREAFVRRAAVVGVGLLATSTVAVISLLPTAPLGQAEAGAGVYDLPSLDGTPAAGSTTNSPLLRLVLGAAVPRVHELIKRQEDGVRSYREAASLGLRDQAGAMAGPRSGETAVLMQSDMHCNLTMIALQRQVVNLLRERYGKDVPALLAISGDLTTNGTAAEGECIKDEAAISEDAPVAAVTGNHESQTSATQMKRAGMTVLEGSRAALAGISVLGQGDPNRSELFGATQPRGDTTEDDVGRSLFATASKDRTDLLLVHEGYAAQAFIGTGDMTAFLDGRRRPTVRYDDGVRDLPASAIFYGHWHRSIAPRVVWNSDGTWTLVMELDTSGGAVDSPTIGHFSTPWSRPQQESSFPLVFLDKRSGLVTGYQLYRFQVDGRVEVEPRVDVGDGGRAAAAVAAPRLTLPHGRQEAACTLSGPGSDQEPRSSTASTSSCLSRTTRSAR